MKNVLVLNDRFPLRTTLINLGDRALSTGLYRLLRQGPGCEIISGGWKNFPYLSMRRLKRECSTSDIPTVLQRWYRQIMRLARADATAETWAANLLDHGRIFNNRLVTTIEQWVKDRNSRGLIETLAPFVLRRYFARCLVEKIQRADLVLFCGAALVADRFGQHLPMRMFECYLAMRLGKPVVAVNQSVDIRDPFNTELVSYVYKAMDLHITREPIAARAIAEMGVEEQRVITSCDTAFAADCSPEEDISALKKREGIEDGAIAVVLRGDKPVDYATWATTISAIQESSGRKVFFLHTCKAQDAHVYRELSKRCRIQTLSEFYDYPTLVNVLKGFDCLITNRYHALAFAIHAHTPFLAINPKYVTGKVEGLVSIVEYPVGVAPPVSVGTWRATVTAVEDILARTGELRSILAKGSQALKQRCYSDYARFVDATTTDRVPVLAVT